MAANKILGGGANPNSQPILFFFKCSECGLLCAFRGQKGPKCLELRKKTMQI